MRYKLNKKRLKLTIMWFLIADVFLGAQSWVYRLYKGTVSQAGNESLKYPHQLLCLLMVISIFFFLRSLRLLFPKAFTNELTRKLTRLYTRFIRGPIMKLNAILRKIFGLPEHRRKRGKDEKSFIFDLENNDLFRRFQSVKNQLRWRDLKTNGEKIRYLFIKYMVKLIKSGYRFQPYKTPDEMKADLALKAEPERLFTLYTGARYGVNHYPVSDDDVEMAAKLVKK